jgi:hypothetical protein
MWTFSRFTMRSFGVQCSLDGGGLNPTAWTA